MNLFQKQQTTTSGYITIPDAIADDGTAAVVHRSSMWRGMMIAFVAGMMLVAGGAVWMQDESSSYTTTAEGLVIATEADPMLAAGGAVWMQDESSSYTTTAEGLVVATEATPNYFAICGEHRKCCESDYGTNKPCCGQSGTDIPVKEQCPKSRPLCEDYIWNYRHGRCGGERVVDSVWRPLNFSLNGTSCGLPCQLIHPHRPSKYYKCIACANGAPCCSHQVGSHQVGQADKWDYDCPHPICSARPKCIACYDGEPCCSILAHTSNLEFVPREYDLSEWDHSCPDSRCKTYRPSTDYCFRDKEKAGKYCWYYEDKSPHPPGQWEGTGSQGSDDCGEMCTLFG